MAPLEAKNEVADEILEYFSKKKQKVKKIFWNSQTGEIIVLAPVNKMDGLYVYDEDGAEPFVPSEDFDLFHRVANEANLIYEE